MDSVVAVVVSPVVFCDRFARRLQWKMWRRERLVCEERLLVILRASQVVDHRPGIKTARVKTFRQIVDHRAVVTVFRPTRAHQWQHIFEMTGAGFD